MKTVGLLENKAKRKAESRILGFIKALRRWRRVLADTFNKVDSDRITVEDWQR